MAPRRAAPPLRIPNLRHSGLQPVGAALLGLLLLVAGCATRTTPQGRQPGTAFEQVLVWNAALADANLSVAKAVIAANEGQQIPLATANAILTAQSKIADTDRQLTLLLKAGKPGAKGQAIANLLVQLRASADELVAAGTVGIKNQKSAEAIRSGIASVTEALKRLTEALEKVGVLK